MADAYADGPAAIDAVLPIDQWVHSLTYGQFNQLTSATIVYLTPAQVASIPDIYWFEQIPLSARNALSTPQIQSLNVRTVRLSPLTSAQIDVLTGAQIRSLLYDDFKYLKPFQIPTLTTAQIASIPTESSFWSWPEATRAALTQTQVQSLNVAAVRIKWLTPQQRAWLTATQVRSLANESDFQYVPPALVPQLTAAQIALIPAEWSFWLWPEATRAALTQTQVRALNVASVRINLLTPQQVGWLTTSQVQALNYYPDFTRLQSWQIPSLTPAQIAMIPDADAFWAWPEASRAALTAAQVQALNVANVRIYLLPPTQVGWLSPAQVRAINTYHDFRYLPPAQVVQLTPAQVATIPQLSSFWLWSAESRAALTATQVRALDVASLGLSLLTPQQVGYLSAAQIQSLPDANWKYLTPAQIPNLTAAQLAATSYDVMANLSEESRAALTPGQVRALNVAVVRIKWLPAQQRAWLTATQVRSLAYESEYQYLPPAQAAQLSPAQIASIPSESSFWLWSAASRAALTLQQVQALNVAAVRINALTSQQIGWLSPVQVQAINNYSDLTRLQSWQIPILMPAQIAMVPNVDALWAWPEASRAALTSAQVQALNVATLSLRLLPAQQIGYLSTAQIQSLPDSEFKYLAPSQIPRLSPAQFLNTTYEVVVNLSDAARAALTRAQLLSMPTHELARYVGVHESQMPPHHYNAVVDMVLGADGLPTNEHIAAEAARVFALVPHAAATHVSVNSGDWNDPQTWQGGRIPTAGANVLVSSGTSVRFDAYMNSAIRTLRIDGTLSFVENRNTRLKADTIVVFTTGLLQIGSAAAPIRDNVTAQIVISTAAPIDATWDPYLLSRGLISRGRVVMYGKEATPYATFRVNPTAGSTVLQLTAPPSKWRVGDALIIPGTDPLNPDFGSELVVIRAIDGANVTISALQHDHVAPAGYEFPLYAALVTRNIQFSAELASPTSQRPHMMLLHNNAIDINNIGVYGFGRTDKSIPINDPVVVNGVLQPGTGTNPRARYAVHFHHTGVSPNRAPAQINGSIVWDSPGWGFVNHSSNVNMDNNVAYGVRGASFVSEDGNEIGSMTRNLSINATGTGEEIDAREAIHDFGFAGHGFWLQGPGVELVGNIAIGSNRGAFVYYTASSKNLFDAVNLDDPSLAGGQVAVPVGSVPLKKFKNNTAIAARTGMETWWNQTMMTGQYSVIENFTAWNIRSVGIDLHYQGLMTVKDSLLLGDLNRYSAVAGIRTNILTHDIDFNGNVIAGFEKGIVAPPMRANVIRGGSISAVNAIYIIGAWDSVRVLDIQASVQMPNLTAEQLQGRPQYFIYADAYLGYRYRRLSSMFAEDHVYLSANGAPVARIYYFEQAAGYVPFPSNSDTYDIPANYVDKTNRQLWDSYQVAIAGGVLPGATVAIPGVFALLQPLI